MNNEPQQHPAHPNEVQQPQPHEGYHVAPPIVGSAARRNVAHQVAHQHITPEMMEKHDQSKRKYPHITLSRGEYVIEEVRRHPIGLFSIWGVAGFLLFALFAALPWYSLNMGFFSEVLLIPAADLPSAVTLTTPMLILAALVVLGAALATYVYNGNRFYLTNESIIQHVQTSIFDTRNQVVNLINVEDASSEQSGILQQVLNYGTLRLSTQGDETIYHFHFVTNPRKVVHTVNDATEKAVLRTQGIPTTEF